MSCNKKTWLSGLIAGASLVLAPSAFAQESDTESRFAEEITQRFQLEEGIIPALEFLDIQSVESSQDTSFDRSEVSLNVLQPINPVQDSGRATSLPWYERFTVAPVADLQSAWGAEAAEFQFSAGERWGFSFGITESERGPQFQLNDVTAGAFYDLTDRFRLGTNLRFSSPEEDVFGQPSDEQVPELKFESAFRF